MPERDVGWPVPFGGPQILVLDTGVLYDDIVYRLRYPGRRGVLVGSAHAGATVLLAADHVYDEIYDSVTGHERRGFSRGDVVSCFERIYLPYLRFVAMPAWPVRTRVLAVGAADPDDAPTAALGLLVAPSLVFAVDPHLVNAGFGRAEDWLALTWLADDLLGYDGTLLVTAIAARAVGQRASHASRALVADLRPAEVAAGVAVGLAMVATAPRLTGAVSDAAQRAVRQFGRAASVIATAVAQVAAERGRRTAQLHAGSVVPDLPLGPAERLARLLAVTHEPILADILAAAVQQPTGLVSEVLSGHPAFINAGRGWQLGRRRLPRHRELAAPRR